MKILVAGDFCPQNRVAELFEKEEFEEVLGEVKSVLAQSDYSIVNFECPVCLGQEKPIEKIGPNLSCSDKGIEAIKWAGFDCVTLANNHFLDYGEEGVRNTIEACKKKNLCVVGGGMSLKEASAILYQKINGQTLAIVNCCEHEFSIATEYHAGSNPLNPVQQFYAIKEARKRADYILVIVHGGHEYYQLPSPRMQETYRFFIDSGADAVVNHHQHCYSGYEFYQGRPILYGLGNFCFDKENRRDGMWTEGYMVELNFGNMISLRIIPYRQCDDLPHVTLLGKDVFSSTLSEINDIIADPILLKESSEKYYSKSVTAIANLFEPLSTKYYFFLKRRGWLPSLFSKKKRLTIKDFVCCESHRDKLMSYFMNL